MTDLRTEYTTEELLATHAVAEPLLAGGVRCQGGFLGDCAYVWQRTLFRGPALKASQDNHSAAFGAEILTAPLETWPANHPNIGQARFLIEQGVSEPIIAALARIGTVEDFRMGLMVHDIAFKNPATEDHTQEVLKRTGVPEGAGADPIAAGMRFLTTRTFDGKDLGLGLLISAMLWVLLVEIKALHVFAWTEEFSIAPDPVAGDGEATRIKSHIRADETPNVGYPQRAFTEMCYRTFIERCGRRRGSEIVGTLWDASLQESLGLSEDQNRIAAIAETEPALLTCRNGADILVEFKSLADSLLVPS